MAPLEHRLSGAQRVQRLRLRCDSQHRIHRQLKWQHRPHPQGLVEVLLLLRREMLGHQEALHLRIGKGSLRQLEVQMVALDLEAC